MRRQNVRSCGLSTKWRCLQATVHEVHRDGAVNSPIVTMCSLCAAVRRELLVAQHPVVPNWSSASCYLDAFMEMYSCIRPPNRSRRRKKSAGGDAGGGRDFSGAAWLRVPIHRSGIAFRLWCPHRGTQDTDALAGGRGLEHAGAPAVAVPDQHRELQLRGRRGPAGAQPADDPGDARPS